MEKIDRSNLNERLLRMFVAIYDTQSVSRASERLDLNQSTVSQGLERLRGIIGDPLFVKSGRGITPTDRAITIAPQIQDLLSSIDAIVNDENYEPRTEVQPFSIAGNIEVLSELFSSIRDKLFDAAPDAPLRFMEVGSRAMMAKNHIEELLASRRVDLAIAVRSPIRSPSLMSEPLLRSELVCFYDKQKRKKLTSVSDFSKARHAVIDFGLRGVSVVETILEKKSIERNIVLRAPNFSALARMMEGTDLVATLPAYARKSVFFRLNECPSPISFPHIQVDMVWHRRSDLSSRNLWLRKLVLDSVEAPEAP